MNCYLLHVATNSSLGTHRMTETEALLANRELLLAGRTNVAWVREAPAHPATSHQHDIADYLPAPAPVAGPKRRSFGIITPLIPLALLYLALLGDDIEAIGPVLE